MPTDTAASIRTYDWPRRRRLGTDGRFSSPLVPIVKRRVLVLIMARRDVVVVEEEDHAVITADDNVLSARAVDTVHPVTRHHMMMTTTMMIHDPSYPLPLYSPNSHPNLVTRNNLNHHRRNRVKSRISRYAIKIVFRDDTRGMSMGMEGRADGVGYSMRMGWSGRVFGGRENRFVVNWVGTSPNFDTCWF